MDYEKDSTMLLEDPIQDGLLEFGAPARAHEAVHAS
jgi:hypothetical protein